MHVKTVYCGFATKVVIARVGHRLRGKQLGFRPRLADAGSASAPPAYKAEEPPNRSLDANLYMQTAAEYRACWLPGLQPDGLSIEEALGRA